MINNSVKLLRKVLNFNIIKLFRSENSNSLIPDKISRKAGKKCCPYGQDGIPLNKTIVSNFLVDLKNNNSVIEFNCDENHKFISCCFYITDYPKAADFIKHLYEMDIKINTLQTPSIHIIYPKLLVVEFHSKPLIGLSYKDFQLIGCLSKFEEIQLNLYGLKPLKSNYYSGSFNREIRNELLKSNYKL